MAELFPFRALRFTAKAGEPQDLICPPYDQIGEEQVSEFLAISPFNAVRLELPFGDNIGAAETLRAWKEDGIVKQDTSEAIMIYEQEFVRSGQVKKVKGLLCRVKIEDEAVILPHEEYVPAQVDHRLALLKAASCEFSPVYSLYDDDGRKTMSRVTMLSTGKPRFAFHKDGVTHRLWIINDQLIIRAIREDFATRKLWIADGHTRVAAAKRMGCDSIFTMLADFDQDGLTVLPSHCIASGLNGFDESMFLSDCEPYFQVISRETMSQRISDEIENNLDALYRQGKIAFGFYIGGAIWTLLILKELSVMDGFLPGSSETFRTLDCSVLHHLILGKLLGLNAKEVAQQNHLSFTTSAKEVIASVQSGSGQCAFLLNPARLKQIREVAVAGEKMPPKSTCFYPAVPAGMVMSLIEKQC
jgi:uncharacterized protein (DUF1015 family)